MLAKLFSVARWSCFAERAWVAWHSLSERKPDGAPVSFETLWPRSPLLKKGEMNRFVYGEYAEPSWRVTQGVADVLGVSVDWLMRENGDGPKRGVDLGPIPPWPGRRNSAPKHKGRPGRAKVSPELDADIDAEQAGLDAAQAPAARTKPKPKGRKSGQIARVRR